MFDRAFNSPKDKIKAVDAEVSPKNNVGKINAAEAPYKKKSYHSMLVPAKDVKATFCILDLELLSVAIFMSHLRFF